MFKEAIFFLLYITSGMIFSKKPDIRDSNIYLINLKSRKDKLMASTFQLNMLRLNFTVIEAVNGIILKNQKSQNMTNEIVKNITGINELKVSLNSLRASKLSPAQIGCWLSHLKTFDKIKNDDKDKLSLILEDDFIADGMAIELINKNLMKLHKKYDWDLVYVGHCHNRARCQNYLDNSKEICKTVVRVYCTHAYILKNKSAAIKLFNAGNLKVPIIADHYYENTNLNRYMIFPHIFKQRKSIKADINSYGGYHTDLLNKTFENLLAKLF